MFKSQFVGETSLSPSHAMSEIERLPGERDH
jgi:hypothetical protein